MIPLDYVFDSVVFGQTLCMIKLGRLRCILLYSTLFGLLLAHDFDHTKKHTKRNQTNLHQKQPKPIEPARTKQNKTHMHKNKAASTSVTHFDRVIGQSNDNGLFTCNRCEYSCALREILVQHSEVLHGHFPVMRVESKPHVKNTYLYTPTANLSANWFPSYLINQLLSFQSKHSTNKITGGRRTINLAGTGSETWYAFEGLGGHHQHNAAFVKAFQLTVSIIARELYGNDVSVSPDVVALIGAEVQQTPHVDLKPGQVQVIMILSPITGAKSTLFYVQPRTITPTPTHSAALEMLGIDADSTSSFARVLKYAPELALSKQLLLSRLTPISIAGGEDTLLQPGTFLAADHTVVHAGPSQPRLNTQYPRIVLFTTFTHDHCTEKYNLKSQYMPAHFCEDPTMPPDRAIALLQEWKETKPWQSYLDDVQSKALRVLCSDDALSFALERKEKLLSIIRRNT